MSKSVKKQEVKEEKVSKIEDAYIDAASKILDPTLLDKSILERMPQPTGWRMLVLPYKGKGVTEGGIVLTKETVNKEALATVVAYVVKQGPLCYDNKEKYGKAWCQEKQWVLIGRYAGARFKLDGGEEVRIINDDDVIATILDPDDIVSL